MADFFAKRKRTAVLKINLIEKETSATKKEIFETYNH